MKDALSPRKFVEHVFKLGALIGLGWVISNFATYKGEDYLKVFKDQNLSEERKKEIIKSMDNHGNSHGTSGVTRTLADATVAVFRVMKPRQVSQVESLREEEGKVTANRLNEEVASLPDYLVHEH